MGGRDGSTILQDNEVVIIIIIIMVVIFVIVIAIAMIMIMIIIKIQVLIYPEIRSSSGSELFKVHVSS